MNFLVQKYNELLRESFLGLTTYCIIFSDRMVNNYAL